MTEPVFLFALAIAGGTIVMVARTIAGAITAGRGTSRAEFRERMEEQTAALDDAHTALTQQATQLAELQERLDFMERFLAQSRDRSALGPGDKRE